MSELKLTNIYYSKRISSFINTLLIEVLAVGILLISYNYGKLVLSTSEFELFRLLDFWLRIVILFCIIAFVSYDAIAYEIHMKIQDKIERTIKQTSLNPTKTISLFLIDIFRLSVSAWLLATIGISEFGKINNYKFEGNRFVKHDQDAYIELITNIVSLDIKTYLFILITLSLWHLSISSWYKVESPNNKDYIKFHGLRFGLNILMIVIYSVIYSFDVHEMGKFANIAVDLFFVLYLVTYIITLYRYWLFKFLSEDFKHSASELK